MVTVPGLSAIQTAPKAASASRARKARARHMGSVSPVGGRADGRRWVREGRGACAPARRGRGRAARGSEPSRPNARRGRRCGLAAGCAAPVGRALKALSSSVRAACSASARALSVAPKSPAWSCASAGSAAKAATAAGRSPRSRAAWTLPSGSSRRPPDAGASTLRTCTSPSAMLRSLERKSPVSAALLARCACRLAAIRSAIGRNVVGELGRRGRARCRRRARAPRPARRSPGSSLRRVASGSA